MAVPKSCLASICELAFGGSLVGSDKYPLKLQKFGDALWMFTMLNGLLEFSKLMLLLLSPEE